MTRKLFILRCQLAYNAMAVFTKLIESLLYYYHCYYCCYYYYYY